MKSATIAKGLKIIIGIALVLAGIYGIWYFWPQFVGAVKAVIGIVILLIGLLLVFLGASD